MLGIVVPITKLSKNLTNLESWLSTLPAGDIKVTLVHDVQDSETGPALRGMLTKVQDNRIVYCEGVFGAPGLARNFGMIGLESHWMWFVDADDLPNLENVLQELSLVAPTVDVVVGQFEIDAHEKRPRPSAPHARELKDLAFNPGIWRMIFRTSVFGHCKFREFRMAEDQLFLIDTNFFQRSVLISEKLFYIYFKHTNGQLTSQKSALSELAKTIPVVIREIRDSDESNRKFLEVILARQMATLLKHATKMEKIKNLIKYLFLLKNLNFRSKITVGIQLMTIFVVKLTRVNNE